MRVLGFAYREVNEKEDFDDLAALQPLYLRRPAITEPRPRGVSKQLRG